MRLLPRLKVISPRVGSGIHRLVLGGLLFGLGLTNAEAAHAPSPGFSMVLPDLVQKLLPAVVNITSRSLVALPSNPMNAAGKPETSGMAAIPDQTSKTELGSGFVIDPNGLIVTNNHVIDGAFDVSVTFQDGTVARAKVIATTKIGDIALLKVNLNHKLPSLRFADISTLRVGDPVIAIGNPLGWGGTVSTGIVSALNRNILIGPFDDFIQTDAALNHGNSGGPLFNLKGEVIGVNTALYTPTENGGSIGIGFAIPASGVVFIVGQLRQFGAVRPGEIGASVQDVTDEIAQAAGVPPEQRATGLPPGSSGYGVIVTDVNAGGPSAAAGLQQGDIVLSIDGKPIADVRALSRLVAVHTLGMPAVLSVWRQGKLMQVSPVVQEWVSLEKADRAALARSSQPRKMSMDLGLQLAVLSPALRELNKLPPNAEGVLITKVRPDSVAGDRGLSQGDVIVKIMNTAVHTPDDITGNVSGMVDRHESMALLLVRNQGDIRWVAIPLDPGKMLDASK